MARLPDWDEDMVSGSLCLHCPQVVPMALAAASAAVIRVQATFIGTLSTRSSRDNQEAYPFDLSGIHLTFSKKHDGAPQ